MSKKEVTTDEILKELIKKSGHDFHLRVSSLLQKKGWKVVNSPHYSDPVTNTNRETDIAATKEYEIPEKYNLHINLYIECKYILHETVIWFVERNKQKTTELINKNNKLVNSYDVNRSPGLINHYLNNINVAKEHNSKDGSKNIENAINQILNGYIYFDNQLEPGKHSLTLRYPVIVVNSFEKMFKRINPEDSSKIQHEQIKENFQYEVDYINNMVPEYYLIDIISFDRLEDFIKEIEINDLEILHQHLRHKWAQQEFKTRMIKRRGPVSYR